MVAKVGGAKRGLRRADSRGRLGKRSGSNRLAGKQPVQFRFLRDQRRANRDGFRFHRLERALNALALRVRQLQLSRKLQHMRESGIAWLDLRREVMAAYSDALQQHLASVEVLQTIGTKYYRAASGRIVTQWPYTMAQYRDWTMRPDEGAFEEHRAEDLQPAPVAG